MQEILKRLDYTELKETGKVQQLDEEEMELLKKGIEIAREGEELAREEHEEKLGAGFHELAEILLHVAELDREEMEMLQELIKQEEKELELEND